MKRPIQRLRPRAALLLALSALALLGGCFDDDDEIATSTASDTGVPASALASPQAYTQFAGSLPSDDRAAPRHLEGVEAPTSETALPEPLS